MTDFTVRELLAIEHRAERNLDRLHDACITGINTDSRTIAKGEAFVALRGKRMNGHEYIGEALKKGALLCVVDARWQRAHGNTFSDAPLLVVKNTRQALGEAARIYRGKWNIPVIAITGSNGKTTTKEMIAAVLATKYNVLATQGNFNNQIGLPATLFRLGPEHRVAVVEAGTNQPGDIAELAAIAQPTHALITNIGTAHVEKLLSREGVADEKAVLYHALQKDGVAFVNSDEPLLRKRVPKKQRKIAFGRRKGADVRIAGITLDAYGRPSITIAAPGLSKNEFTLRLNVSGAHHAYNAAAALAVGMAFKCSLAAMRKALAEFGGVDKRSRLAVVNGVTIIDDSYNANPDSVKAAVATLLSLRVEGEKIVVLGDMLELGAEAKRAHEEIGEYIAASGAQYLLTFGKLSATIARIAGNRLAFAKHFTDRRELASALHALAHPGDALLFKGSRSMQMEEALSLLLEFWKRDLESQ